jgi:hypothetical protein
MLAPLTWDGDGLPTGAGMPMTGSVLWERAVDLALDTSQCLPRLDLPVTLHLEGLDFLIPITGTADQEGRPMLRLRLEGAYQDAPRIWAAFQGTLLARQAIPATIWTGTPPLAHPVQCPMIRWGSTKGTVSIVKGTITHHLDQCYAELALEPALKEPAS